jgi:hypothetical protein
MFGTGNIFVYLVLLHLFLKIGLRTYTYHR